MDSRAIFDCNAVLREQTENKLQEDNCDDCSLRFPCWESQFVNSVLRLSSGSWMVLCDDTNAACDPKLVRNLVRNQSTRVHTYIYAKQILSLFFLTFCLTSSARKIDYFSCQC